MADCIFCKIINKELPSYKVYEDGSFYAFLDIFPVNHGHVLVIPKTHYPDILHTPPEVAEGLMRLVQKIAPAVLKATKSEGFNLGMNTGSVAGQAVFHTHAHIMPRFPDDGLRLWGHKPYEPGQMETVSAAIASEIV